MHMDGPFFYINIISCFCYDPTRMYENVPLINKNHNLLQYYHHHHHHYYYYYYYY